MAGKDVLLVCDTTEMCDALNRRTHEESVDADAATVTGARGQRIGKGDVIVSRRNDATIEVYDARDVHQRVDDPVRNGQRWRVLAVDPDHNRIAARRLEDGARTVFSGDYLSEHVTHGYRSPCIRPRASAAMSPMPSWANAPTEICCTWRCLAAANQTRRTCMSVWVGKVSTNTPNPHPVSTSYVAAPAARPPDWYAPSLAGMSRPTRRTPSPPTPTAISCLTGSLACWSGARTRYATADMPTNSSKTSTGSKTPTGTAAAAAAAAAAATTVTT